MKLRKAARGKKHVAAEAKLFSGVSYKKVNRSKVLGFNQKNVSYITPFTPMVSEIEPQKCLETNKAR